MTHTTGAKNVIAGVLIALAGAGTLWATAEFPRGLPAAGDPALLPRTLAVGLLIVGAVVLVEGVAAMRTGRAGADDGEGIPIDLPVDIPDELLQNEDLEGPPELRVVGLLTVLLAVYGWAAFHVGYVVSTAVVIITGALLLGRQRAPRSVITLVIFAVVMAGAVYYGFFELLSVRPPRTPLP